ncbi:MAG: AAA family ATPase [Phototrophicales bacterium]|nr:MAG: AAA family ATPase [Phototrophicales bacterium]
MNIVQSVAERLTDNIARALIGKRREIRLVVLALLCQGHILLEDVPGVGKTMMAKALAKSVGAAFSRIQFTPDMLPSDVTGISIFNQRTNEFEFRPGPIMANIVLADEINRATPKTQSALLETMEERQVTVDGTTYPLEEPFLIIATQNPIEYEGTFPLPEAQLDRFMIRLKLGYPSFQDEITMLDSQQYQHPVAELRQVISSDELLKAQAGIRDVYLSQEVKEYIVSIVSATRHHPDVYLGSSPRGALALYRMTQAYAATTGRDYVVPDDVKLLADYTLAHRVILGPTARTKDISASTVIQYIINTTPIPGATVGKPRYVQQ